MGGNPVRSAAVTSVESGRRIRIICLGNELVHDDGIGVRVGRVLQTLELPAGVSVEVKRMVGLDLLDELRADQELVLVDAMRRGGSPGSFAVMELVAAAVMAETPYCCHGIGLAEVLEIASRLHPERLPPRAVVVGVEAAELEEFGTSLTPALQAALPGVVVEVLRLVGADDRLQRQGHAAAERVKGWAPAPHDALG